MSQKTNTPEVIQFIMKTLDLHGTKHVDVDDVVCNFLNWNDVPVRIVTGRSKKMKELVFSIVKKYGYEWDFESSFNYGSYIVKEIEKKIE